MKSNVQSWFDNDDLFRAELAEGFKWATAVHEAFLAAGIDSYLPPSRWRKAIAERREFRDEEDVVVTVGDVKYPIESKSRRLTFTDDPATFPYRTAFVDTVEGWDLKSNKPKAIVLTSQITGSRLVVPVRGSRDSWTIKKVHDRIRDIDVTSYECPRNMLVTFQSLIDWLIAQNGEKATDIGVVSR